MSVKLAIPGETATAEHRVALTPEIAARLQSQGMQVMVQSGAGDRANCTDEDYRNADVGVTADQAELYRQAQVVLRVAPPEAAELARQAKGSMLVGFLDPMRRPDLVRALLQARIDSFAMELIPRSTRAQSMDALSSQRSVAGYRAAIVAAAGYGGFFPMLTVPTGTVRPATVLIIGAGVAGLQAIATARRLGAIVEATDIRPAAREQVASLGGRFISIQVDAEAEGGYARELNEEERRAQRELLAQHVAKANVVICTAEIPGRAAPRILDAAMVESMAPGSLVLDLAASSGGNCELTRPGECFRHAGVELRGPLNVAAEMAPQASDLYARNLLNLLSLLVVDGKLAPNWDDEILQAACLTRDGEIRNDQVRALIKEEPA